MALDNKPKETNKPTPPVEETKTTPIESTTPPVDQNPAVVPGESGLPEDNTLSELVFKTDNVFEFAKTEPNEIVKEVSPWSEPTEHPEARVTVLCEVGSHLPVEFRDYVKGQFDHTSGNFFTTKDGPYKILDVTRWMEVK